MLRTVVIASLALVAAAACGGKSASPKTSPEPKTAEPAVAEPAAPAGDFGALAIAKMKEFKGQLCACADAACVAKAEETLMEWAKQHSDELSAFEPSKEQDAVADGIENDINACRARIDGSGASTSPSGPAPTAAEILTTMRGYKDKVCACKDTACVEKVETEMMDWAMKNMEAMKDIKPTPAQDAEADKIQNELDACRTRVGGKP